MVMLGLLLVWVLLRYALYRRQIWDICRQMQFLMESGSKQNIRLSASDKDLKRLAKQIDEWRRRQNMREIELRTKDRQLKEALANVSHDIRTPLTSLKGYFTLFRMEEEPEKREEYLDVMQERMNTLSELLEELFMYTRLQDTGYTLELTKQDMTPFVMDTVLSFYEECSKRNVSMGMQVEEAPLVVSCNEGAVKRMVSNVMRNALQHGNGRIELVYKAEGQHSLFVCRNSLDEKVQKDIDLTQVFERFYKADEARSKNSTGLGLAITKELVERMDGTIDASYENGLFAISIRLPLVQDVFPS